VVRATSYLLLAVFPAVCEPDGSASLLHRSGEQAPGCRVVESVPIIGKGWVFSESVDSPFLVRKGPRYAGNLQSLPDLVNYSLVFNSRDIRRNSSNICLL
jgi:hypothetical protein